MRILVAEDDARLRQQLVAALRNVGHEVDETGDGIDASRLLMREPYDAAVLDITMPGTTPFSPAFGPATGSFNGLHPKSNFLAISPLPLALCL